MKVMSISAYISVIIRDVNGINSTAYNIENLRWINMKLLYAVSKSHS